MSLEEEQVAPEVVPEVEQEEIAPAEQTAEQEAAPDDDAAFLEGFDSAKGIEAAPVPETPKLFGKYTEAEVLALLEKVGEVDKLKEREAKVFGTLGSYKQMIETLQGKVSQAPAVQEQIRFTKLREQYPELADALMEDIGQSRSVFDADGYAQGKGPSADFKKEMEQRIDEISKVNETKLLSVMHPDWRTIPSSTEFTQWKGTLSPEELQVVDDSWDALSVGTSLSTFKAWKSQATQAAQAKQVRQNRLEAAVTPKGGQKPPPAQTENDAFLAGWKSVRGV